MSNLKDDLFWLRHFQNVDGEDLHPYASKNNLNSKAFYYKYRILICPTKNKMVYRKYISYAKDYLEKDHTITLPNYCKKIGVAHSSLGVFVSFARKRKLVQSLIKKYDLKINFPDHVLEMENDVQFKEVPKETKPIKSEAPQQKIKLSTVCGIEIYIPESVDTQKVMKVLEFIRGL